jgi:hypothetical protein
MAVVISVSLTQEQKTFVDEMGLSASSLLQASINELIESSKVSVKALREAQEKINLFRTKLEEASKFIDRQGLMEKWLLENGY